MERARTETVHLDEITVVNRARQDFSNESKETELQESITEIGLLHPLVLMESDVGYILLAGERRLRAVRALGWDTVPVSIYPPLDACDIKTVEMHENFHRLDLTYAERVGIIRDIHNLQIEKYGQRWRNEPDGHSLADTAEIVGVSKSAVAQAIELANMIEVVPALANMKNEAEAQRTIRKAKVDEERALQAAVYEEKILEQGEDKTRQGLLNSYIAETDLVDGLSCIDSPVDVIEFDPPYGISLDEIKKTSPENMDGYEELDFKTFREKFPQWIAAIYGVMAENSWMICWFSIKSHYEFVATTLEEKGFKINRKPSIWIRPSGQTRAPETNLASCYQSFFYARKGSPKLVEQGRPDVYGTLPIPPSMKVHPTERPIELYEEILKTVATPNCLIVSPCLGSGNVLLAAANLQLRAFGFDLSTQFRPSYVQKVKAGYPGSYKSLEI